MRSCTVCKKTKSFVDFHKSARAKDGIREQCKSCVTEYNRTKGWENHIRRKYGMTPEDYQKMFDDQDGLCMGCFNPSDEKLHIDHCHETGKVRGLLCLNCNRTLGYAKDDPTVLRNLADYIEAQDANNAFETHRINL